MIVVPCCVLTYDTAVTENDVSPAAVRHSPHTRKIGEASFRVNPEAYISLKFAFGGVGYKLRFRHLLYNVGGLLDLAEIAYAWRIQI